MVRGNLVFAFLVALPITAGRAQTSTVVGIVRDSARVGIAGADVSIPLLHLAARSDDVGRFMLRGVPVGKVELSVRRLGFEPSMFVLTIPADRGDTLALVLDVKPLRIDGMIVNGVEMKRVVALEEFYRRRSAGGGWFVTRAEIEVRNPSYLSDVLRGRAGLQVVRLPRNSGSTVRFLASRSSRRDCPPQFWLDGQRLDNFELDDVPPRDVEGIELYEGPGTTPMQFAHNGGTRGCGTVVIWTRLPGT